MAVRASKMTVLAGAAALLVGTVTSSAAVDELILASLSRAGAAGSGPSTHPAVASDNRHVAFQTDAGNLAPAAARAPPWCSATWRPARHRW